MKCCMYVVLNIIVVPRSLSLDKGNAGCNTIWGVRERKIILEKEEKRLRNRDGNRAKGIETEE